MRAHETKPGCDHEARLRLAFGCLRGAPFVEASRRVRRAVRSATKAPHPCSDPARPYHETLTLAWTRLVAAHIDPAEEDFESFLTRHPFLRDRVSVLAYYSPERLGSDRARHEFVLPDRAPLPSLPSFSQLGVSE